MNTLEVNDKLNPLRAKAFDRGEIWCMVSYLSSKQDGIGRWRVERWWEVTE